jgi:hypothetical protein
MKAVVFVSAVLWAMMSSATFGQESAPQPQPLKCNIGPVARTYGMTPWLVYSCDDDRSVVIISAPGNPAMPFYFMFSPSGDGYKLYGEGTGRKEATAAAFAELEDYTQQDIAALIKLTKPR